MQVCWVRLSGCSTPLADDEREIRPVRRSSSGPGVCNSAFFPSRQTAYFFLESAGRIFSTTTLCAQLSPQKQLAQLPFIQVQLLH